MVCKKDVVTWFKSLKSYKRVDVMCSLMQLCVPFELRFLGTCLEDLAKRDFQDLRQTENEANSLPELNSPEVQCISNHEIRTKLALYVSLLHSSNEACSNKIFKILTKDDINSVLKLALTDDNVLEELLSIYTLALNHPAFSFDQKIALDKIFSKLQEEESRLYDQNLVKNKPSYTHASLQDSMLEKPSQPQPIQSYQTCIGVEEHPHPPCYAVTSGPPCQPPIQPHLPPKTFIAFPTEAYAGGGEDRRVGRDGWAVAAPPSEGSPMVSRTSSPSQPSSRPASPRSVRPPHSPPHPLRDTLSKEMPTYVHSLHNYSIEQLGRMNDDELREIGLPPPAIGQLRAILAKQLPAPTSNGLPPHQPHPPPHLIELRKKNDVSPQLTHRVLVRSVDGLYPGGVCMGGSGCYNCYMGPRGPGAKYPQVVPAPPAGLYPTQLDSLRSLRLDQDSGSSASDTASDHSPPDTPGPEGAPPPFRQPPPQPRAHRQPIHPKRRDVLANGVEDRKVYGGGVDQQAFYTAAAAAAAAAASGWPHQFIRPAAYPAPFPFAPVPRPPPQYPFQPNGEMVYQYPTYPPHFPPPSHPPPKQSCYNCGSPSHAASDCPESTMEEITKHGQYRIDYSKQQQQLSGGTGSPPAPSDPVDK